MNRTLFILLVAVATVAIGLALFYRNNINIDRPKTVNAGKTVTVQRGKIIAKVAETGSLEPLGVVEIKSEQSGEVIQLFVKEGDRVAAGQRLAVIQQESGQARQAAQFRANLEEERLNIEEAQRELDRQRALFAKGFASQKDVEQAEKNYEKSKVKHDLARRQLLLMLGGSREALEQYLQKDLASEALDQFIITSPTSGTVIEMGVQEGEMITSGTATVGGGTPLMKIADLSRMLVKSRINEVNITSVKPGQPVEMRLDAIPGRVYHGSVLRIAPQGQRINNVVTYEVTMEITDADQALKPSMTANVDIVTGVYEDALYLPIEALDRKEGQDVVYVIEDEGPSYSEPKARPVQILTRTENVAVIVEGVKENDRVMIPSLREPSPAPTSGGRVLRRMLRALS